MPPPENVLDYTTPARRRAGISVMLMYAAFLSGLLYLLFSQAGDGAPLRVQGSYNAYSGLEGQLKLADADPNPAQLQVLSIQDDADPVVAAIRVTRVYYLAQYLRYPHRLYVGQDDQIINNQDQLMQAAHLPPGEWMRKHQVHAVYSVYDVGMGPPRLDVRGFR